MSIDSIQNEMRYSLDSRRVTSICNRITPHRPFKSTFDGRCQCLHLHTHPLKSNIPEMSTMTTTQLLHSKHYTFYPVEPLLVLSPTREPTFSIPVPIWCPDALMDRFYICCRISPPFRVGLLDFNVLLPASSPHSSSPTYTRQLEPQYPKKSKNENSQNWSAWSTKP